MVPQEAAWQVTAFIKSAHKYATVGGTTTTQTREEGIPVIYASTLPQRIHMQNNNFL